MVVQIVSGKHLLYYLTADCVIILNVRLLEEGHVIGFVNKLKMVVELTLEIIGSFCTPAPFYPARGSLSCYVSMKIQIYQGNFISKVAALLRWVNIYQNFQLLFLANKNANSKSPRQLGL